MPTIVHLTFSDYCRAASAALGLDLVTASKICDRGLAESALAAPAAGFGDHEESPSFPAKVAVLLQRVAGNHALPDGNKRTALLCAILFCNINGFDWEPPQADDPDGAETAEIVESAAAGHLPLAALSAWVDFRLLKVPRLPETTLLPRAALVLYPAEFVGALPYIDGTIAIGELTIRDVHGYNPAGVYIRRISGKTDGISVAEIIISVVGDGYGQEELDTENDEAERYPLGPKEFWRSRLVGKATYGADSHPMTDAEFESDWDESQSL